MNGQKKTSSMIAASSLLQEADRQALYAVFLSAPCRGVTLCFSVTPEGALGFDNRQPNAGACARRQPLLALAAEMTRVARERVPSALRGRTQRGHVAE